jgi:hypothetical protein
MALERLVATRYVVPLREGGSLPAIVDTDCGRQYVLKFRGAGQGPKALVAEALAAGIGEALSLPVPQAAVIELGEGFGSGEPNPEIQDLLRASTGKNFGLSYLPGALGFDPVADLDKVEPALASAIVWFDAFLLNVDRTVRNPNLLLWQEGLWMIDHGACLYFQHSETDWLSRVQDRFPMIANHILLAQAADLRAVHDGFRPLLTRSVLEDVVAGIPDEWLDPPADRQRKRYVDYLEARLDGLGWLEEAEDAGRRL